jgi:glycosyltransferase involved in cell wall biosynthesis
LGRYHQEVIGLKIAVFTPFVKNSAIALVTNEVFTALKDKYNIKIDIYTSMGEDLVDTDLNVIIFNIDNLKKTELAKYNYCIYVLGNHYAFHRECYLASKVHPGIVILHDQTMADFWWSVFKRDPQPERWLSERSLIFGGGPEYKNLNWEEFVDGYVFQKMPYKVSLRPLLEDVLGVFTHAEFFADYIAENFNLPVDYAYVPLYSKYFTNDESTEKLDNIINKARRQGRKIIVSTGIVHPVKRNDKIVSVLLNNRMLREKICYIIIGENSGEYCSRLINYSERKLKGSLYLLGRQPYDVMSRAISEADICINLRYPNSEVCSLSLLEQMSENKAVLVIGSGIYNEFPDYSVIKLELDSVDLLAPEYNYTSYDASGNCREIRGELKAIEDVLLKLVHDEIDIFGIGENAAHFVREHVTREIYANIFFTFLNDLPLKYKTKELQRKFLTALKDRSEALFVNFNGLPHYTDDLIFNIDRLFNQKTAKKEKKNHITLGIWYTFPEANSTLDRESVSMFTGNLCKTLVNDYDINLEVWVYSWNLEPVNRVFASIPSERLIIVTEQNYSILLKSETHIAVEFGEIGEHNYWRLAEVARLFSKADLFMPVILSLDDVIYTGKPVVVVVHDLFPVYLREMFAATEHGNEIYMDTLERITNFARKNATFVIDTPMTLLKQVLPYVKNLHKSNTLVIRMPKNTSQNIDFLSETEVRKLIGTQHPYLFYPTQVRPHKNFQLLISAFAILLEKYPYLKLVLTGDLRDVPMVWEMSRKLETEKSIINVGRLSTVQLYSCYKYAACTPTSTMHEAALNFQAIEAMSVGTPAVLTDADMNRDEIEGVGMLNVIPLIAGDDVKGFADEIEYVINNRDAAINRQEPLFKALTKRTWSDAAKEYYELFFEILN